MAFPSDNENWIVEEGGIVVEKKVRSGLECLAPWERLVYCLWVADYGMSNAGDLRAAHDIYPEFQLTAQQAAAELSLPLSFGAFSMSQSSLESEYSILFESMCNEIRNAQSSSK